MIRRIIGFMLLTALSATHASAQGRVVPAERYGSVSLLGVSSAELPELLQMAQTKIGKVGFADKWRMPVEVLNQDVVIAEEISLVRGRRLVLAPRNSDGSNTVFFIARTIRIEGNASEPVSIIWEKNPPGLVREPIKVGKAPNGAPGDREGGDGKQGANGVTGNAGLTGRDAPTVVFIALKLEANGPVRFQLSGQNGASGGPGQDGGDGGAGRPGRPAVFKANRIGIQIPDAKLCEDVIPGGNGGAGGNGGSGGTGGIGGQGGTVVVVAQDMDPSLVRRFVDPQSDVAGGKGGPRGARGLGGKGGPRAPQVAGPAPCGPAPAGAHDGAAGQGRSTDDATPDLNDIAQDGKEGGVVFSRLTASQARSIGLLQ